MRKVIKKVCLLGDGAVGKSSLIRRFIYDAFEDDYKPTIGTKIVKKVLVIPHKDIELTMVIWDIMGHKSYLEVPAPYYQGVEGVLVVSDITRLSTLENLDYWLQQLFMESGSMPTIFITNKIDLVDQAAYGSDDVEVMAANFNAPFFFTSAKTGESVEQVFQELALDMTRNM